MTQNHISVLLMNSY